MHNHISKNAFSFTSLTLSLLTLGYSAVSNAGELSLEEVWRTVSTQSKSQKSAALDFQAAQAGKERSSRHWLPRLYLDAKSFQTNDPGLSFFSVLSQRSVTAADFNPDSLNHPDSHLYTRGALGVDLPLYEGGMKTAQNEMRGHIKEAKSQQEAMIKITQYAEVSRVYGSINGLNEQKSKLEDLQASLSRLIHSYQLGNKSNPVGYSGLLGLKTLANRLQGMLAENLAKQKAARAELTSLGLPQEGWMPQRAKTFDFIDRYLPDAKDGEAASVLIHKELALAAESGASMETARFLPRVGAFAEEYIFNGDRATDNGYSAGLYLQWSLFNPDDYGASHEAKLRATAAQFQAEALAQQNQAEALGLTSAITALRENLKLMDESESLLTEQTKVATDLFRNGSISALQLVEALSRRADLIASHADAQLMLLKLSADRATKLNFNIPIDIQNTSTKNSNEENKK
jgi:outer membrane protein TolC